MYRRVLAMSVATINLLLVLACGGGAWGVQQGLIQAPTGIARLGNIEVLAFTGMQFSTSRPPRGYYTVWVALRSDSRPGPRRWRPLVWARRLVRLEVPPASAR